MRTTLKRGIGRGADANGNGHAVLPPGVLTPIARYRQPPRQGSSVTHRIPRLFLWLPVLEALRSRTHIPINSLIGVNFVGFIRVVDKLGGVYVDVDRRSFNNHTGPYGYAAITLQPGYQRLTGKQALDFVRYRHTDSDLFRVARQQMFVRAAKERLARVPRRDVPSLLGAIQHNVEVGRAGG